MEDHGAGVRAKNANNDDKITTNKTKKNNSETPARPIRRSARVTKPKKNVVEKSNDDDDEENVAMGGSVQVCFFVNQLKKYVTNRLHLILDCYINSSSESF